MNFTLEFIAPGVCIDGFRFSRAIATPDMKMHSLLMVTEDL